MSRRKSLCCSLCSKRFSTQAAVAAHGRDYHGKRAAEAQAVPRKQRTDDDEESYADLAVQAEVDRAAGVPNINDWLLPPR